MNGIKGIGFELKDGRDVYKRQGLLFYGSTILPFVDHFPKNTELYRIMTTKPQELKKEDE